MYTTCHIEASYDELRILLKAQVTSNHLNTLDSNCVIAQLEVKR